MLNDCKLKIIKFVQDSNLYIQCLTFLSCLHFRIHNITQHIAQHIEGNYSNKDSKARGEHPPEIHEKYDHISLRLLEHQAPRGGGLGDTEAKEGQGGLGQDVTRNR